MFTVVLWGMKETYNRFYNNVRFEEMKGNISVKGIISLETYVRSIDGYEVLKREEIGEIACDYIIIMAAGDNAREIRKYILSRHIDPEKIISGEVFGLPYFDFTEYVKVLRSHISIIADCCFGGCAYSRLRMPFLSPFINTAIDSADYMKLLENFESYMDRPLELDMEQSVCNGVPFGKLGDISIGFPHDFCFKDAVIRWNRRKGRLRTENMLVMMRLGDDIEMAERFDALPFRRKAGFSSVPIKGDSIYYLPDYHLESRRPSPAIMYDKWPNLEFCEYVVNHTMDNMDLLAFVQGDIGGARRRDIG